MRRGRSQLENVNVGSQPGAAKDGGILERSVRTVARPPASTRDTSLRHDRRYRSELAGRVSGRCEPPLAPTLPGARRARAAAWPRPLRDAPLLHFGNVAGADRPCPDPSGSITRLASIEPPTTPVLPCPGQPASKSCETHRSIVRAGHVAHRRIYSLWSHTIYAAS